MKNYLFLCLLLFSVPEIIQAQSDDTRKKNFNIRKGYAIEGYDPVSYFEGHPKEGKEALKYVYKGVVYLFNSQANLDKFKANPVNFEPAYGGWCAFAMGENGEKVKIDPETYKLVGGKLYLFYNFWGNNTLNDWNKNETELKVKGDANWAGFFH